MACEQSHFAVQVVAVGAAVVRLVAQHEPPRPLLLIHRLVSGRREAGQVYMKSKFNHCDNALSLNGSCKVIVSFSLKGISFLTFLNFSPQLISSALVPFYFFLKIISWSIVVNFHTPPLKSITLYFSMNFHFLFCSKRNTDVF